MAPGVKLGIKAGADADNLVPVPVNYDKEAVVIDTEAFRGRVAVRVKGYGGDMPDGLEPKSGAPYFEAPYGSQMTYSIQAQGRFSEAIKADDLLFGNAFDRPIRNSLPYGTSLALRFVSFVDPNLQHDLYADKPWAYSPLLSTVYRCQVDRGAKDAFKDCTSANACFENDAWPAFPTPENDSEPHYTVDDISPLFYCKNEQGEKELVKDIESDADAVERLNGREHENAERARATWLGNQRRRAKLQVTPDDVITVDFCNGYIDFNTLHLVLPYAGMLNFDLQRYWDGQPVRYVCKHRHTDQIFFVVHWFELHKVEDQAEEPKEQEDAEEPKNEEQEQEQEQKEQTEA